MHDKLVFYLLKYLSITCRCEKISLTITSLEGSLPFCFAELWDIASITVCKSPLSVSSWRLRSSSDISSKACWKHSSVITYTTRPISGRILLRNTRDTCIGWKRNPMTWVDLISFHDKWPGQYCNYNNLVLQIPIYNLLSTPQLTCFSSSRFLFKLLFRTFSKVFFLASS